MAAGTFGSVACFLVCTFLRCLLLLGSVQDTHAEFNASVCVNMSYLTAVDLSCTANTWFHVISESHGDCNIPLQLDVQSDVDSGLIVDCTGPRDGADRIRCQEKVSLFGVPSTVKVQRTVVVSYECISENLTQNVCDDAPATTVAGPLYIASPSFFPITRSDRNTCQCHVTGTALHLRGLASFLSPKTNFNFNFEEDEAWNHIYLPEGLAYNYDISSCDPNAINVSSTCSVNVTFPGDEDGMFWIKIAGNGTITFQCNDYNGQTTSVVTTRPTAGAPTTEAIVAVSESKSQDAGPIVGAFFGGAAFMVLVAIVGFLILRCCRSRSKKGVPIRQIFATDKGKPKGIRISQLTNANSSSVVVGGGGGPAAANRDSGGSESYSGLDKAAGGDHKYGDLNATVNMDVESGRKQSQRPVSDMYMPMEGEGQADDTGAGKQGSKLPAGGKLPKPSSEPYLDMNVPVGDRKTLTHTPSETGSEMYMPMDEPPSEQAPRPPSHPPPGHKRETKVEEAKEKPKADKATPKQNQPPDQKPQKKGVDAKIRPHTQHPAQKQHPLQRPSNSDSHVYKPPDKDDDDDEPNYGNTGADVATGGRVANFYVSEDDGNAETEEIYENEDDKEEYVEVSESAQPRVKGQGQGRLSATKSSKDPAVYVEEEEPCDDNVYENPDNT